MCHNGKTIAFAVVQDSRAGIHDQWRSLIRDEAGDLVSEQVILGERLYLSWTATSWKAARLAGTYESSTVKLDSCLDHLPLPPCIGEFIEFHM